MLKFIPLLLLGFGVFTLSQAMFPLAAYKIWEVNNINSQTPLINPLENNAQVLGVSIAKDVSFPYFISSQQRSTPALFSQFYLTISKVDINDTEVYVDSNDLDKGLAQLPGSSLPGEVGNVFISGHSGVVGNKFSKLTQLKKDDRISLRYGQQRFNYSVVGIKIVDPKDTSVINPPDKNGRYLTLMTCVPPGINTKRLIVLASLD